MANALCQNNKIYSDKFGNYLVRVRAQVMSRDDSSGGWLPLGGGGLSNVSVFKKPKLPSPSSSGPQQNTPTSSRQEHDYIIYGKRISDERTILNCPIHGDFEYHKVMPTFHHWNTGAQKFGLAFQTAADARAFDRGVCTAFKGLLKVYPDNSNPVPPSSSPDLQRNMEFEDFMLMDLPLNPKDLMNRVSSSSSSRNETDYNVEDSPPSLQSRQPIFEPMKGGKGDNYPYVQLAMHDYNYPILVDRPRDSFYADSKMSCNISQANVSPPILPPKKPTASTARRMVCKYCNELYYEEGNVRGQCEYGPDGWRSTIDALTCMGCVRCFCYHCAADSEGEFAPQPCDCVTGDNKKECTRRWLGLTLLSLCMPCMWCYPLLKMCHWCGTRLGVCGAKHCN
ncbi:hypothetical protein WA026_016317 [Henosepilachna vigintioctopunctata]|uniref:WH1 domain-containing protein n=1 Tax=Henosepilachna vigintioctopunctata TaxID=420089 RepID=A0AAW1UNN2_9CUCU